MDNKETDLTSTKTNINHPETSVKEEEKKVQAVEEPQKEEKQESKPPKETEKVKVDSEEVKVDVEQLKAELKEANEKAGQVETLAATVETMKVEAEKQKAELKEYEELITNLIETKLKEVPEDFKELIPDNLTLKQKLNWLEKAEAKGLFIKEEKKKPNVEIGKPMNVDVPSVDTSKLAPSQLLKLAYNTVKR